MRHAYACSRYLILAVDDEIFVVNLRASCGTHRAASNPSSVAQKISPVRHQPSSQSFYQAVCTVCDPAAISTGLSLSSGLSQNRHFPTINAISTGCYCLPYCIIHLPTGDDDIFSSVILNDCWNCSFVITPTTGCGFFSLSVLSLLPFLPTLCNP